MPSKPHVSSVYLSVPITARILLAHVSVSLRVLACSFDFLPASLPAVDGSVFHGKFKNYCPLAGELQYRNGEVSLGVSGFGFPGLGFRV